jgi:hypothetical protein
MVAAGVGAHVGIELFVLSEGRYQPQNFPTVSFDVSQVAWDPSNNVSNYTTLAAQALAANGGRGWLTESAGPAVLSSNGGFGSGNPYDPPLDTTYEQSCVPQVIQPPSSCYPDGGPQFSPDSGAADAGDADASSDAGRNGHDGGAEAGTGDAGGGGALMCTTQTVPCDDLDLAMTGMTAGSLWITRLRADLPANALAADLVLEASPAQIPVSSLITTNKYTVPNYNPCGSSSNGATSSSSSHSGCACREAPSGRYADAIVLTMGLFGLGLAARKRRRRVRTLERRESSDSRSDRY